MGRCAALTPAERCVAWWLHACLHVQQHAVRAPTCAAHYSLLRISLGKRIRLLGVLEQHVSVRALPSAAQQHCSRSKGRRILGCQVSTWRVLAGRVDSALIDGMLRPAKVPVIRARRNLRGQVGIMERNIGM
jgi:hypothetical protein